MEGGVSGPENATVAAVGKCAPNKEPEKRFCLPKVLRPEEDKLQAIDNIVYHAWISKCVTEGKIVDCAESKVPLVSHTTKELPWLNLILALLHFSCFSKLSRFSEFVLYQSIFDSNLD